jgi:hypothetical protein
MRRREPVCNSNHRETNHQVNLSSVLPSHRNQGIASAIPPAEVMKVCLRLRHLIRECVPCELEESAITRSHSTVITSKVVQAAKEAGGEKYRSCVVCRALPDDLQYVMLIAPIRFMLYWSTCDGSSGKQPPSCGTPISTPFVLSPVLLLPNRCKSRPIHYRSGPYLTPTSIEGEEDIEYLLHHILLRRYSFLIDKVPTAPTNVIEKAVDLHAVRVIGSSGYQKCIQYLWRGWLVQDEDDPSQFVDYKNKANTGFFVHMDPDRMRSPRYQNAAQLLFSIIYLALYTAAVNSANASGVLDGAEIALYIFTFAYVCDEFMKYYKAGYHILGFWNVFNFILYGFLTASLVLRIIGQAYWNNGSVHRKYNELSYNLLSFVAPMFWSRLLLYFDSFRFFGAMLVVLKVMMKESLIFFALLIVVIIGFLQAFIGLDIADDNVLGDTWFIIEAMLKAIMQSPEFDGFEDFGHPFGLILYYCFTFVVMVSE